jgi:hypothetical protein
MTGKWRRSLPSAGLLLLAAAWAALALLFFWGAQEPGIDRVWTLLQRCRAGAVGEGQWDAEEEALLAEMQSLHPELEVLVAETCAPPTGDDGEGAAGEGGAGEGSDDD